MAIVADVLPSVVILKPESLLTNINCLLSKPYRPAVPARESEVSLRRRGGRPEAGHPVAGRQGQAALPGPAPGAGEGVGGIDLAARGVTEGAAGAAGVGEAGGVVTGEGGDIGGGGEVEGGDGSEGWVGRHHLEDAAVLFWLEGVLGVGGHGGQGAGAGDVLQALGPPAGGGELAVRVAGHGEAGEGAVVLEEPGVAVLQLQPALAAVDGTGVDWSPGWGDQLQEVGWRGLWCRSAVGDEAGRHGGPGVP